MFPLLELQKHSACSVGASSSTNDLWSWITTETSNSQVLFSLFINLLPELRLINDSWYELQPETLLYCRLCKGEQRYTGSKLRLENKRSVEGSIFDQGPSLSAEAEVWWRWRSEQNTTGGWKKQSEELRESAASRNYSVSLTLTTRILHYRVIWSIFTIEILISAALKWRITHHFIFYSLMPSSQTAQQQPSNRDIKSLEKHITAAEMRQRFTTPSTVHPPHDSLCPSVYNVLINDNKTETISFKYTSNNHRQILYMFMSM